ncbi:MAG TPA: hypothetical protein VFS20_23580, partial [Longimicrobium sp.]|nr:hypothetical protein [Longimicrobium sp.]
MEPQGQAGDDGGAGTGGTGVGGADGGTGGPLTIVTRRLGARVGLNSVVSLCATRLMRAAGMPAPAPGRSIRPATACAR